MTEVTTMRVRLLRVEGTLAHVESFAEPAPFALAVRPEQAESLAPHVGAEVDAEMTIDRDESMAIESGTLDAFHPMECDDNGEAWMKWFSEACKGWNEVVCIECELGRDCEKHPEANP